MRKAHQIRYHIALADIISMVKHAARETEPPDDFDRVPVLSKGGRWGAANRGSAGGCARLLAELSEAVTA